MFVHPSFRPHGATRLPTDGFSWNFIFRFFFRKSVEKIQDSSKFDKNNGTSHEYQYTFWLHLAQFFLKWEMFQTKIVEKIKTHILCSVYFFSPENRAVYVIMWKNNVDPDRTQVTVWRTRMTWWITTATDTHSEYVIQFTLPLQQILYERPSLLCYTYIDCFVILLAQIEKIHCARNWAATLKKFTNRHCHCLTTVDRCSCVAQVICLAVILQHNNAASYSALRRRELLLSFYRNFWTIYYVVCAAELKLERLPVPQ